MRLLRAGASRGSYRAAGGDRRRALPRGDAADTDWREIVRLYDVLERVHPSPVVSLNRAVAVAMADGPQRRSQLIDALAASGELDGSPPAARGPRRPAAAARTTGRGRREL